VRIDTRGMKHPDPLIKVREIVRGMCTTNVDVEVVVDSCEYGRMISGFAKMSGCRTEVVEEEGLCIVRIKGDMCKCS